MYEFDLNQKLNSLKQTACDLLKTKIAIKNKSEQLNSEISRLQSYIKETTHRIAFIKEYESKKLLLGLLVWTIILSSIAILTALAFAGFAFFTFGVVPIIHAAMFSVLGLDSHFNDKFEHDVITHMQVNKTFNCEEFKSFCKEVDKDLSAMFEPFNEHAKMFNEQRNPMPSFLPMKKSDYNDAINGIVVGVVVGKEKEQTSINNRSLKLG